MMIKHVRCDLQTFTEYISKFDERLGNVFARVDHGVAEVKDNISVQVKHLMEDHITKPIDMVASGVTCGFIATHYRSMVDGFCYQGVYGLRVIGWCYVACGMLAVLLIAVIHSVWRVSVDETKLWDGSSPNIPARV